MLLVGLGIVTAGGAGADDDTSLFTTAVPPNVLLTVDSSVSMRELMYHPNYEPELADSCPIFGILTPNAGGPTSGGGNLNDQSVPARSTPYTCDPNTRHCRFQIRATTTGFVNTGTTTCLDGTTRPRGYIERTFCGRTRKLYVDGALECNGHDSWHSEEYVEWLFSSHADPYWIGNETNTSTDPLMIDANANGTHFISGQTFPLYKRSRIVAAREIARDVIYQTNTNCQQGAGWPCPSGTLDRVRFGVAMFDGSNGGFVRVPIDTYATNALQIEAGIDAILADDSTPLAETLFKTYTYFMQRGALQTPFGRDGSTRFPRYQYNTTTGDSTTSPPPDPLRCPGTNAPCDCQKNFTIIITDGYPNGDQFATSGSRTAGFSSFGNLIGNFVTDAEVEEPGPGSAWRYLDDVASWVGTRDFRLDLDGTQTVDVYTVGFNTPGEANELLSRTAVAGNGLFFAGTQAQEITDALVSSIADIIEKSQSFTAATVPATRTSEGGNFYTSLFLPAQDSGYWEGHLKLFNITADGDILDANGSCALLDPLPPGECKSGSILPSAVPYWDAGEEIPPSDSRTLYTTLPGAGRVPFDTALTVSALGDPASAADDLTIASAAEYGLVGLTTAEQVADSIVQNVRGCELGTGVLNACVARPWLLGDIFHSNPLVIGSPRAFIRDPSYAAFATTHQQRDKVIYAGANDGFLHAFHAGEWQAATDPPGHDRGTGEELFGFMPWPARRNVRELPLESGQREYYFVDGSPAAADVWIHPTPTTATRAPDGSEWRTVLVGGLRQGGAAYYALDVTDPNAPGYPELLWEFPAEDAPASLRDYFGETWGTPVLTRVKVEIAGSPYERWVAVVTGGYHPTGDPNDPGYVPTATQGRAIFVVDVKTGEILAEKKFDPLASGPESEMLYAIAATPSVFDLDGDQYADVIYVGDLGGNLWKWVVAYDPVQGNVGSDPIDSIGSTAQPGWSFRRFFQAVASPGDPLGVPTVLGDAYKSIFYSPAGTLRNRTLWLAFGTGERADLRRAGDPSTDAENNRLYSVKDPDPLDRLDPLLETITEADLYDATDDAACVNLTSQAGFLIRGTDAEKFVTNTEIFSYWVITSSFVPTDVSDPCSAGGDATLYIYNVYCSEGFFYQNAPGAAPPTGQGMHPGTTPPVDPATRRMELGAGMPTDPKVSVGPGSDGGTRVIITQQDGEIENPEGPSGPSGAPGQLYWRELVQ